MNNIEKIIHELIETGAKAFSLMCSDTATLCEVIQHQLVDTPNAVETYVFDNEGNLLLKTCDENEAQDLFYSLLGKPVKEFFKQSTCFDGSNSYELILKCCYLFAEFLFLPQDYLLIFLQSNGVGELIVYVDLNRKEIEFTHEQYSEGQNKHIQKETWETKEEAAQKVSEIISSFAFSVLIKRIDEIAGDCEDGL